MADRRLVAYTKRLNEEHAATGDVEGARRLIEQMLADGVEPSIVTANTLIKAYRQARMPKGAEAVLREMALDWGLTADGASYCTVIDAWGLSGSPDEAARVLQEAEAAGVADSRCYAARLRHLADDREVSAVLLRARELGVPLDLPACNAALAVLAGAGRAAEVEQLIAERMAPPERVRPDPRSHALRLKAHCVGGDVAAAEALLLGLLDACEAGGSGGGGGGSGGTASLAAAVTAVMDGHVSASPPALEAANRLMETALARGVKPDTAMFNVLIKGHASATPPQPRAALEVFARLQAAGLAPTAASAVGVLDAWCELNCVDEASAFFDGLLAKGVLRPNEAVYNVMIKGLARCRCKRARGSCGCDPCRCCQPAQAEERFREMAAHGLAPDTITLNTLLDAHCSAGQLVHACSLLESICRSSHAKGRPAPRRSNARGTAYGGSGGGGGGGGGAPCQPNLVSFETVLRGALRQLRSLRSRPAGSLHADCCGGGGGGAAALDTAGGMLELLSPTVRLLGSCGPTPDARLLGTLAEMCDGLRVEWRPPPAALAEPAAFDAARDADGGAEAKRSLDALVGAWEEATATAHLLPTSLMGPPAVHAPPQERQRPPPAPMTMTSHAPPPAALPNNADGMGAAAGLAVTRLRVEGMMCEGCVRAVERALRDVAGVSEVEVHLDDGAATVGALASVAPHSLVEAVEAAGKRAQLVSSGGSADKADGDEPPLSSAERRELVVLRARVRELEAALATVKAAVGNVAL